jgi:hypothetical protein
MNSTIAMFILLSSCTSILHSNLAAIHPFLAITLYTVHKHLPVITYFFLRDNAFKHKYDKAILLGFSSQL